MAKKAEYEFEIDGKTYTVPAFKDIPMGAIRKARHAKDETDMAFTILEEVTGEGSDVLAALDLMNAEQFGAWLNGWMQGASVGEASSSSN